MIRLMIVGVVATSICACNSRPPVGPTQSTTRVNATPTPSPPPPPSAFSVSGIVYESTASGRRSLAGVGIDVSLEYQSWPPRTTSDAQGHYQVSGSYVASNGGFKVRGELPGYSQPCRAPITPTQNGTVDIYMVSNVLLSTTGAPSSMPSRPPTVTGLIFEQTPQGRRPIGGATVIGDFTAGDGWAPSATTISDVAGHYMLCGVDDIGFGLALDVRSEEHTSELQ